MRKIAFSLCLLACVSTLPLSAVPSNRDELRSELDKLHQQAAEGDLDAKATIRKYKAQGYGIEDDYVNVYSLAKRYEETGDPEFAFRVGNVFLEGKGGQPVDHAKAKEWFEKGEGADHVESIYNLGFLYYKGFGVEKDDERAQELWLRSAEMGHALSVFELTWIGDDRSKQIQLGLRAGQMGIPAGYQRAANLLAQSRNPKARELGVQYLERNADRGFPESARMYAIWLLAGRDFLPADPIKALDYLEFAMEKGNQSVQNRINRVLFRGEDTLEVKLEEKQERIEGKVFDKLAKQDALRRLKAKDLGEGRYEVKGSKALAELAKAAKESVRAQRVLERLIVRQSEFLAEEERKEAEEADPANPKE